MAQSNTAGKWAGMISPIRFAPFDLRVYLRIVLLCLIWKLLSTDYKALALLIHGVDLHAVYTPWFSRFVHWYSSWLLDSPTKIVFLQLSGGGFLLLCCFAVRRWLLILGLLPVLAIEWCAFQYRHVIWAFEVPLAVLTIMALWPFSWQSTFQGGREVTTGATRLGFCIALYCGLAYFLCGHCKIRFDPYWWKMVHVENWYASRFISKGPLPGWFDGMAYQFHLLFNAFPRFGSWSALGVEVLELTWLLGLLNRWVRWTVPPLMFLSHLVFYLASGFLFLNFAVVAFAILVPWRVARWPAGWRLRSPVDTQAAPTLPSVTASLVPTPGGRRLGTLGFTATVAAVFLLAVGPAWQDVFLYPFMNFNGFAWSMESALKPCSQYRLGYVDPTTGAVAVLSQNHAGFLEHKQFFANGPLGSYAITSDPQARAVQAPAIWQYVRALRPTDSNHFLLGQFAAPAHVLCASVPVPRRQLKDLHIVQVDYNYQECGTQTVLHDLGPVPPPPDK